MREQVEPLLSVEFVDSSNSKSADALRERGGLGDLPKDRESSEDMISR